MSNLCAATPLNYDSKSIYIGCTCCLCILKHAASSDSTYSTAQKTDQQSLPLTSLRQEV